MKLRYKNNQWEDENGVPITPNDQEKVTDHIAAIVSIDEGLPYEKFINWQPEKGKLYDSGDLVFELEQRYLIDGEWTYVHRSDVEMLPDEAFKPENNQQFWVLKKAKEERLCTYPKECKCEPFKGCLKSIKQYLNKDNQWIDIPRGKEHLYSGRMKDYSGEPSEEAESKLISEVWKDAMDVYFPVIKQLQSRIAELEEAVDLWEEKSLNDDEKIAELEGQLEIVQEQFDAALKEPGVSNQWELWREVAGRILGYWDARPEERETLREQLHKDFKLVRIKESN